jgi:hypothetical protein
MPMSDALSQLAAVSPVARSGEEVVCLAVNDLV